MTQLKDGGRQSSNREERSLSASTVIARWQGNGWDEPCKSRGLRTVLWAAGGEIPPADPAAASVPPPQRLANGRGSSSGPQVLDGLLPYAMVAPADEGLRRHPPRPQMGRNTAPF